MTVLLWVDDVRPAPPGWAWAKDARAALDVLRSGEVEYASLDHDLGDGRRDGTWLVERMIERRAWPRFKPGVHSSNWEAAARMLHLIRRHGPYDEYHEINGARAGADAMTPHLARAIVAALAPLRRVGLGPDAVALDWRTITLLYRDALAEKIVAAELAPDPIVVDGARYGFTTAVAR